MAYFIIYGLAKLRFAPFCSLLRRSHFRLHYILLIIFCFHEFDKLFFRSLAYRAKSTFWYFTPRMVIFIKIVPGVFYSYWKNLISIFLVYIIIRNIFYTIFQISYLSLYIGTLSQIPVILDLWYVFSQSQILP